jgi:hypothetical protein
MFTAVSVVACNGTSRAPGVRAAKALINAASARVARSCRLRRPRIIDTARRAGPHEAGHGRREKQLQTEQATVDTGSPEPLSARGGLAAWWAAAAPWLMGLVVLVALSLTYFMYDLLQHRLYESSTKFNATLLRFERYWTLYDATVESTLALKWDLSAPAGPPASRTFETEVRRFELHAAALSKEVAQPGVLLLSQAASYDAAMQRLRATLATLLEEPVATPTSLAAARQQTQQVLERLATLGQEARQRQSLSSVFGDEVEEVWRQVLMAFSGIVAVLALFGAVAAQ